MVTSLHPLQKEGAVTGHKPGYPPPPFQLRLFLAPVPHLEAVLGGGWGWGPCHRKAGTRLWGAAHCPLWIQLPTNSQRLQKPELKSSSVQVCGIPDTGLQNRGLLRVSPLRVPSHNPCWDRCAHTQDPYPKGLAGSGPAASLRSAHAAIRWMPGTLLTSPCPASTPAAAPAGPVWA